MKSYFLKELARTNKPLLGLIIAWLGFAAFSAWTKFEGTPVYLWTMFAVPLPERDDYTVTVLYADGQQVSSPLAWQYFANMVPLHSAAEYQHLKEDTAAPEFRTIKKAGTALGLDMEALTRQLRPPAEAVNAYPVWLKRYVAAATGRHIDTLKLVAYTVTYTASGRLQLLSSGVIFAE